jgi:hypothetical protein
LEYCPPWRPGTNNQGVTAAERPEPLLNVFSELTLEEYTAGAFVCLMCVHMNSVKHSEPVDPTSRRQRCDVACKVTCMCLFLCHVSVHVHMRPRHTSS